MHTEPMWRYNRILYCIAFMIVGAAAAGAQPAEVEYVRGGLSQVCEPGSTRQWMVLRRDARLRTHEFLREFRGDLGLGPHDSLVLVRKEDDRLGYVHYRMQQMHDGIVVEGGEFILHELHGYVGKANGYIVKDLHRMERSPRVDRATAAHIAREHLRGRGRDVGERQDSIPDLRLVPVLLKGRMDPRAEGYRLAYKCYVHAVNGGDAVVYVDALSSHVLYSRDLVRKCTPGTAVTRYNGVQGIRSKHRPATNDYILHDECIAGVGGEVHTLASAEGGFILDVVSPSPNWSESDAVSAHWAGIKSYEYFFYNHDRRSFDGPDVGGGGGVTLITNDGKGANYSELSSFISLGQGDKGPYVSLDIVGHEWTHGVQHFAVGSPGIGEAEPLNESFSDIFGTMIEFYASAGNYDIGENVTNNFGGRIRSMSNPHLTEQPDTYGDNDSYWDDNYSDLEYDVHINAGVQNYWFYLLSEGGAGYNENDDYYLVNAIGRAKAAAITYRSLIFYLTSQATFADARAGSIQAAQDLYGECSDEQFEVARAWYAVGVGPNVSSQDRLICATYTTGTVVEESLQSIYAGNCTPPLPQSIVQSGADVTFKAGVDITLYPGFEAQHGSAFLATIVPTCTNALKKETREAIDNTWEESDHMPGASRQAGRTSLQMRLQPNPSSKDVVVHYEMTSRDHIRVTLYDLFGRKIHLLADGAADKLGRIRMAWKELGIPAGTYFVVMTTSAGTVADKLVLVD